MIRILCKTMYKITALIAIALALFCGCATGRGIYPEARISIDDMKTTVAYLTSIHPPRNYENMESLNKSAKYIYDKMAHYGLEPREQPFFVNGQRYINIVASVGPRNAGKIVVGAHYDVSGDSPGADDNASGIAGLLEIARFAKKQEAELRHNIEFVAYSLEEPPFFGTKNMGSYMHAESLHKINVSVIGMISLEMIGYFSDQEGNQNYPIGIMKLFYPDTGNFIAVVGNYGSYGFTNRVAIYMKMTSVDVETLKAPSFITGIDFSDHRNYWEFGYDAVMVSDTAFYRNKNYHTSGDTIETLSFDKMQEVVKGICWAIINL